MMIVEDGVAPPACLANVDIGLGSLADSDAGSSSPEPSVGGSTLMSVASSTLSVASVTYSDSMTVNTAIRGGFVRRSAGPPKKVHSTLLAPNSATTGDSTGDGTSTVDIYNEFDQCGSVLSEFGSVASLDCALWREGIPGAGLNAVNRSTEPTRKILPTERKPCEHRFPQDVDKNEFCDATIEGAISNCTATASLNNDDPGHRIVHLRDISRSEHLSLSAQQAVLNGCNPDDVDQCGQHHASKRCSSSNGDTFAINNLNDFDSENGSVASLDWREDTPGETSGAVKSFQADVGNSHEQGVSLGNCPFKVGDMVMAKYPIAFDELDGAYFPAHVEAVHPDSGSATLSWSDGDQEHRVVPLSSVRILLGADPSNDEVHVGDFVEALYPVNFGFPLYHLAIVREIVANGTVTVHWVDGDAKHNIVKANDVVPCKQNEKVQDDQAPLAA